MDGSSTDDDHYSEGHNQAVESDVCKMGDSRDNSVRQWPTICHEYEDFRKLNGIHRVLVASYHPSSNGLAERAVKTVKQGMSKMTEGSLQDKLSRFCLAVV